MKTDRETRRGIAVTVRFWQDKKIEPKKAYAYGKLSLKASRIHGIKSQEVDFNDPGELITKLEELLKRQGISLHKDDLKGPSLLGAGHSTAP